MDDVANYERVMGKQTQMISYKKELRIMDIRPLLYSYMACMC